MTTIEDKMALFSKIIYDKLEKEKQEKLNAFNDEAEKKLNLEKEKIEELRKSLQKELTKKAKIKASEMVAKEKLNMQREVLFFKDNCIKKTLEDINKKLHNFVNSDEYKDYLLNLLDSSLKEIEEGNYYIILQQEDYKKFQREIEVLISKYSEKKLDIKLSEEDFIGGFILKDMEGKFKIDNSLYSSLQASKESIGIRIMEVLT